MHIPEVPHHYGAWGGIKELLRVNREVKGEETTTREESCILEYCGHRNEEDKYQPNRAYLGYR